MAVVHTIHIINGVTLKVLRGPAGANILRDGKAVAHARINGKIWALRVPGHIWPVTPDMPTARFNQIPGAKITETPCKAFPSRAAALAEVVRLLKEI